MTRLADRLIHGEGGALLMRLDGLADALGLEAPAARLFEECAREQLQEGGADAIASGLLNADWVRGALAQLELNGLAERGSYALLTATVNASPQN
jgi:hypothetical protein